MTLQSNNNGYRVLFLPKKGLHIAAVCGIIL